MLFLRQSAGELPAARLAFEGDVRDRERVRATADHITYHIRNLAHESGRRIQQTLAAKAGPLSAPARLVDIR